MRLCGAVALGARACEPSPVVLGCRMGLGVCDALRARAQRTLDATRMPADGQGLHGSGADGDCVDVRFVQIA